MIHGSIKGSQIVDYPLRNFSNHLALGKASKRKFLILKISATERGRVSVRVSHSAIARLTLYISYEGSGLKK